MSISNYELGIVFPLRKSHLSLYVMKADSQLARTRRKRLMPLRHLLDLHDRMDLRTCLG
jgi:hypothetical protein